jgi:phosphoribosyl 1,2-cyclic phosphodiesterase
VALASGSNGNAVYVETPDFALLIDAGVSDRSIRRRAAARDVDLSRVRALIVTHNHSDHVSSAGVVHRRSGAPLFITPGTLRVSRHRLGALSSVHEFRAGTVLEFGGTVVRTVPTPHDGVEGVAVVVEAGGARLGILTDLGHPFPALAALLPTLDAAFLESNYDPRMLAAGPYPEHLKARIAGPAGHLSNEECADLALCGRAGRLRRVVLSHLSGENNTPATALAAAAPLRDAGLAVDLAPRDGPSPVVLV